MELNIQDRLSTGSGGGAGTIKNIDFVIQRDAGQIQTFHGEDAQRGLLACLLHEPERIRETDLPPEAFTPPPSIRSAVVHMQALPRPRFPADAKVLSRLVAAAFNQRRKMLRAALKGFTPDIEDRLVAAGLNPTDRAEQVPIEGFCALAREVSAA